MLSAIASGTLLKPPEVKTSKSGSEYCHFILVVPIEDKRTMTLNGVATGDTAEKIAKLSTGDALSVTGNLKPNRWKDKETGEQKNGLTIVARSSLSAFDSL